MTHCFDCGWYDLYDSTCGYNESNILLDGGGEPCCKFKERFP